MGKIVKLTNPRYGITGDFEISEASYDILFTMHQVRTEEALQSMLSACYGANKEITSEMIEKVIIEEALVSKSLEEKMQIARDKYAKM